MSIIKIKHNKDVDNKNKTIKMSIIKIKHNKDEDNKFRNSRRKQTLIKKVSTKKEDL